MLSGKTVTIDNIIERVHRDYGIEDLYNDEIAEWIWDSVGIIGTPYALEDATPAKILIENHRGVLPYDLYSIEQVREYSSGRPLREMTDVFFKTENEDFAGSTEVEQDRDPADETREPYDTIVGPTSDPAYFTYKTQGNYIYTGLSDGYVEMAYKSFPIDRSTMLPAIPKNARYIRALVSFIAYKKANLLMLKDLLSERKFDRIEQDYLFNVGAAESECILPDKSRMETIVNRWKSPMPYAEHFDTNYKYLGSRDS